MSFMASMFGTEKPVIGMLHLQPLPGDPLYYPGGSHESRDPFGFDRGVELAVSLETGTDKRAIIM